jgi:hypothetical protein
MNNEQKQINFLNKISCIKKDLIHEIEEHIKSIEPNCKALQFNTLASLNSHIEDDSCVIIGLNKNLTDAYIVAVKLSYDNLTQLKPLDYFDVNALYNIFNNLTKYYYRYELTPYTDDILNY